MGQDTHVKRATPGGIPIISPTLHCVAMTALVWLRSSFGFTLFRPRSIFFAFSFSVCVLGYMAWHDPEIWQEYRAVCVFSAGAAALYWLHLAVAFSRELRSRGELDIYTGTSHLFRVIRRFGFSSEAAAIHIRLWLEPAAVLLVSGLLRNAGDERHLSKWLVIVAACMFCKEALNVWAQIRVNKIAQDMADRLPVARGIGIKRGLMVRTGQECDTFGLHRRNSLSCPYNV